MMASGEPAKRPAWAAVAVAAAVVVAALAVSARAEYAAMKLTVVNNCPFTVWPAVAPSAGGEVMAGGGFELPSLSHRSFPAPARPWSGRIWARTACSPAPNGALRCATGDCAGRLQCAGLAGKPPATLVQVTLHHGGRRDQTSYGVSVVDGFNVGASVTPHEGRGVCPVLGCRENLTATCPGELQLRAPEGHVLGCKSGCEAFGTDELCCRNMYASPRTCRASNYSQFFKRACPQAFTYAHDTPSLPHDCVAPRELKVIFCH